MSWRDFDRLINEQNTDVTAWMEAIRANPNTPEDALKVALLNMIQRENGEMLEKLTRVVIDMVRNADALLDALMEHGGFPVAAGGEPVVVIGQDDPRETFDSPQGYFPAEDWELETFDAGDEGPVPGHGGDGAVPPVPPALPFSF